MRIKLYTLHTGFCTVQCTDKLLALSLGWLLFFLQSITEASSRQTCLAVAQWLDATAAAQRERDNPFLGTKLALALVETGERSVRPLCCTVGYVL